MICRNQAVKYLCVKFVVTLISFCCLLLTASLQSCKNKESSGKAVNSLDTSQDPCAVAKDLAQKREKEAIEPLIQLIKRQEDNQIIKCAAEALAAIDSDKSVNILVTALHDSNLMEASRSALALGIINNRNATKYLLAALWESRIPCPAAMALGMMKDPSALEPLIKAMHHDDSSIRGCAIQALALYHDPSVCEALTDIFMTDSDQGVQFIARAARETIQCPSGDKHSAQYSIADSYCRLGQRLIDVATPLLENTTGLKEWQANEWQKSQEWQNVVTDILPKQNMPATRNPEEEKDMEMKFAIATLITEWGDNVFHYRLISEADQLMKSTSESAVKDKMARLRQLCPNLAFPDYRR